jgi:hypothetical protein
MFIYMALLANILNEFSVVQHQTAIKLSFINDQMQTMHAFNTMSPLRRRLIDQSIDRLIVRLID